MKSPEARAAAGRRRGQPILASGVPVHCHYDEVWPAAKLKLYPGNYRKHPPKQLAKMHKVIVGTDEKPGNGWRRAVVVSSLSGYVTKGNGAAEMAKHFNLDVPVEIQKYSHRSEELRDLIADNRLAALAKDDDELLRKMLSELDETDLELTSIDAADIEELLSREEEVAALPEAHELFEHYDYIVLFFKSELDLLAAHAHFGISHVRKPRRKKNNVGIGRVIDGAEYLKRLAEGET